MIAMLQCVKSTQNQAAQFNMDEKRKQVLSLRRSGRWTQDLRMGCFFHATLLHRSYRLCHSFAPWIRSLWTSKCIIWSLNDSWWFMITCHLALEPILLKTFQCKISLLDGIEQLEKLKMVTWLIWLVKFYARMFYRIGSGLHGWVRAFPCPRD